MDKKANLQRAIVLLEEVDSLIQGNLDDCYDLYENVNMLRDAVIDRAEDEGIVLEGWKESVDIRLRIS